MLGSSWLFCFIQWRSHSAVFPSLFPSHTDRCKDNWVSHTTSKSKFLYMRNMIIGSMFSYRAALLINEIMTATSFDLFELRNSINKRPYYFTTLFTHWRNSPWKYSLSLTVCVKSLLPAMEGFLWHNYTNLPVLQGIVY